MIALLEAHRAGLLRREHWLPNLVSGIIVGVVALPLAMAFAIASGAKPEQGLYTAIVAGLAVSILGFDQEHGLAVFKQLHRAVQLPQQWC